MENELFFECDYRNPYTSDYLLTALVALCFLVVLTALHIYIGTLFILFVLSLLLLTVLHETAQHYHAKIQIRENEICVVRDNRTVMRTIALRDVRSIQAAEKNGFQLMVEIPTQQGPSVSRSELLFGIADPVGFERVLRARLEEMHKMPQQLPQAIPAPQPLRRQPALSENEINEIRAAEHLVQQGRISPEQFAGMYSQPEPQQALRLSQDEIDARNAAVYMQRREMLAQQLGSAENQTNNDEDQSHGQRSAF